MWGKAILSCWFHRRERHCWWIREDCLSGCIRTSISVKTWCHPICGRAAFIGWMRWRSRTRTPIIWGGMAAVLANFHPRELWLGVESRSPELQKLLEDAKRLGVVVIHRKAGDNIELGGSTVSILAPASNFGGSTLGRNDDSLVMKISFGQTSALLEGDAERREEQLIAREQPQADLLKIAHHGSTTSTIPELLAAVRPHFAVISSGVRNVYGHPRKEVLDRLEQSRVAT